jgi:hypothetical protein
MRAIALLLVLAACIAAPSHAARADYYPPTSFNLTGGAFLGATGVLIHSGPTVLGGACGFQSTGAATAYLEVFDATSQPSTGATPVWQSPACALTTFCQMIVPAGGIQLSTGAYVVYSSTGPSYTAVSNSATFYSVATRP